MCGVLTEINYDDDKNVQQYLWGATVNKNDTLNNTPRCKWNLDVPRKVKYKTLLGKLHTVCIHNQKFNIKLLLLNCDGILLKSENMTISTILITQQRQVDHFSEIQFQWYFHLRKCIWKFCLHNDSQLATDSMCQ